MAFISEVHGAGKDSSETTRARQDEANDEFIEIAVAPGENLSDFIIETYTARGVLTDASTAAGVTGSTRLSDLVDGSTSLGVNVSVAPDPEHPDWTIVVIPVGIVNSTNGGTDSASAFVLYDDANNVIVDAVAVGFNPITVPLSGSGVVSGQSPSFTNYAEPNDGNINVQISVEDTVTYYDPDSMGNAAVSFARGTLIKTRSGDIAIEQLKAGDYVYNIEGDLKPIRWVGSRKLDCVDLDFRPKLKPIVIRKDSLGPNFPTRDLTVSPQHRILVRSRIAKRMFDAQELLVPANKLTGLDDIDVIHDNPKGVEYFHLLFDHHEIIWANGALTESLFTGPQALKSLSPEARAEIETLFPEICDPDYIPHCARCIPQKGKHIKDLVRRHKKHNRPIYSTN